MQVNLFFNSPYQVISWDVLPDWKGWYIMFGQEFLAMNPSWNHFIIEYPFFRLDESVPFNLPELDAALADGFFKKIFEEYHSNNSDKFQFIQSYTSLLLQLTKRYFGKIEVAAGNAYSNRTADILLLSKFQTLIDTHLATEKLSPETRSPSFYASQLHVHPNHLNAVVKRITGKTASGIITDKLIVLAKSLLLQTGMPAKEISFQLHFKNPAHFSSFFKKATGITLFEFQQHDIL